MNKYFKQEIFQAKAVQQGFVEETKPAQVLEGDWLKSGTSHVQEQRESTETGAEVGKHEQACLGRREEKGL